QELVRQALEKELAQAPVDVRDQLRKAQATPVAGRSAEQKQLLLAYPRISNAHTSTISLYDAQATQKILDQYQKLTEAAQALRPADDYIHALTEVPGQVPQTFLFFRGDFNQPRQP